jgi:hypothetical protein
VNHEHEPMSELSTPFPQSHIKQQFRLNPKRRFVHEIREVTKYLYLKNSNVF